MTVGLQVMNDAGTWQIDQNYRNLCLRQKYVFTTAGDHITTLENCIAPTVVLYSTDDQGIAIYNLTVSGSTFTWQINGIGEVYIFDLAPPSPASGFGLQVFDSLGNVTFDSSLPEPLRFAKHLRVQPTWEIGSWSLQTVSDLPRTYEPSEYSVSNSRNTILEGVDVDVPRYLIPPGRKYGWIQTGVPYSWMKFGTSENIVIFSFAAFFVDGDMLKLRLREVDRFASTQTPSRSGSMFLSMMDITGL